MSKIILFLRILYSTARYGLVIFLKIRAQFYLLNAMRWLSSQRNFCSYSILTTSPSQRYLGKLQNEQVLESYLSLITTVYFGLNSYVSLISSDGLPPLIGDLKVMRKLHNLLYFTLSCTCDCRPFLTFGCNCALIMHVSLGS